MLKNFLDLAAAWNAKRGRPASTRKSADCTREPETPMADDFKALIAKVATGASLTREEAPAPLTA